MSRLIGLLAWTAVLAAVAMTSGGAFGPAAHAGQAAQAAHAAAQSKPSAPALCRSTTVPCSVQVPATWAEGERHEVGVTGKARVTVKVQAQRLVRRGGASTFVRLGKPVSITTDKRGFGAAELTLPRVTSGSGQATAGPVLLTLADADLSDLDQVLGTWASLLTRSPVLLGDGFDTQKPVGTDLVMHLDGAITGTSYDVEIDAGTWTSIGTSTTRRCPDAAPCSVGYRLPRGLSARTYDVRLVDRITGGVAGSWRAEPSVAGVPTPRRGGPVAPAVGANLTGSISQGGTTINPVRRARSANLDLPDDATLAQAGTGASPGSRHPATAVRVGAGVLTGAALCAALLLIWRRRA